MQYSLVRGGKRFRPVLALLIGEAFGVSPQRVMPWAAAVEMIHTYSLIHDDLPCMDNDDFRRGEPTNHKVFGESSALLAGDTLLTEAFGLLANQYSDEPTLAMTLVRLLVEAAGYHGMIGGQAIDLTSKKQNLSLDELIQMHEMKTGALIRVASEGAAVACGLPLAKRLQCREFGRLLGFAFQLKDDLLDSVPEIEAGSFPAHLGLAATEQRLFEISDRAKILLTELGFQSDSENERNALFNLVQMNLERTS